MPERGHDRGIAAPGSGESDDVVPIRAFDGEGMIAVFRKKRRMALAEL